ncbi:cation:proton antiporter domain-containing protein [Nocardiopsis xinjiangensis]|uniref:cation:proton antiporter domain-containing protein n=1 Tax=Nocardiopsis xinjiangensis TaxID=124285 RepID=UPI000349DC17|nr:cation:proton antiporter [Nocardiopsis xinjiangensis]
MAVVLAISVLFLGYALISGWTRGAWLTAPMVFVTGGLVLGPAGTGVLDGTVPGQVVRILTEATLVLVLFSDAVRIDLRALRRDYHLPLRLLGAGLPLGAALGALLAWGLLPTLGLLGAVLLSAVLIPTDAALGESVVADERLPGRIKQGLNVESGLNGGLVLPVVVVLSAMAGNLEDAADSAPDWVFMTAQEVALGLLMGLAVGGLGGRALVLADTAGWINGTYRRLFPLALAAVAYTAAETIQGNGLLSAFAAGLLFGTAARSDRRFVHQFTEREGELVSMLTFLLFGALVIGPRLGDVDWRIVVYAVLSLVVVRPLAVAVATLGTRLRLETVLFLGWFGPRGLASIVFALMVVEQFDTAVSDRILVAVGVTVLLSVYAHGITDTPWTRSYARRAQDLPSSAPENAEVTEHPRRWPDPGPPPER